MHPTSFPTRATATATIRTPDVEAWEHAAELLEQATRAVVEPTGATLEFAYHPKACHPRSTLLPRPAPFAGRRPRWWGNTTPSRLNTAAVSSFAWYAPGARLVCPPGHVQPGLRSARPDIHSGAFDVDERSIGIGGSTVGGGPHWPSATAWHPAESS